MMKTEMPDNFLLASKLRSEDIHRAKRRLSTKYDVEKGWKGGQ